MSVTVELGGDSLVSGTEWNRAISANTCGCNQSLSKIPLENQIRLFTTGWPPFNSQDDGSELSDLVLTNSVDLNLIFCRLWVLYLKVPRPTSQS